MSRCSRLSCLGLKPLPPRFPLVSLAAGASLKLFSLPEPAALAQLLLHSGVGCRLRLSRWCVPVPANPCASPSPPACSSAKGWLELSLHLTVSRQPTGVDVSKPSPGSPPPALASTGSGSFKESADDASSVGGPSVGSGAMTAPGASPFFFNRLR